MVVLHFHAQIADALKSGDFQPEIEMCIEFKVVVKMILLLLITYTFKQNCFHIIIWYKSSLTFGIYTFPPIFGIIDNLRRKIFKKS